MSGADIEVNMEDRIVALLLRFVQEQCANPTGVAGGSEQGVDSGAAARTVAGEIMNLLQPAASAEQLYTVAVRSTHKVSGDTYYGFPGCTPEIGTLADAQECLEWVNEGTPSAPDAPFEEHVAIYQLHEVGQ